MLCAVILTLSGSLLWATKRSDDISVERQERVTRHAIQVALNELALQQETVAIWDDTAMRMAAPVKDVQWLYDNTGLWLFNMFRHDETWLLDEQDRPVVVVVNGRIDRSAHFSKLKSSLAPLLEAVRRGGHGDLGVHDRHPGRVHASGSQVLTTNRAEHETHLTLVGGRPAAASIMLIKPSTSGYVGERSRWPAMVSIRYLDSTFLDELSAKFLIDRPRFSLVNDAREDEWAFAIRDSLAPNLGYLIWKPEMPGSRIIGAVLPANVGALCLLALLTLTLLRGLTQALAERGRLEEHATHLAFHDALTGLPNRILLNERLTAALAAPDHDVALLLIDLDRFKQVNDTLGHLAGDELIREFAARLLSSSGEGETIARIGGDEFAILLCGTSSASATDRCQTILALFARPFDLLGNSVHAAASIGTAQSKGHPADAIELMRRADVALYRAKGEGRNCARMFRSRMDAATKRRARIERDLRIALASNQFALWSQDLVGRDGAVVGEELLLRWQHPELGLVPPSRILPIAEDSGLIIPIGDWILHNAIPFALRAKQQGLGFTAINLSPAQLRDETFAERVIHHCRSQGLASEALELEITERTLLDDNRTTRASLQRLREAGFRIALDDFGTGYSSLSYLRRFTVDKIKIDRSFVADLETSAEARSIVAAIVALGRALGLTIAAEGVETEQQEEILLMAGCDQLQGHRFAHARPMAAGLMSAAMSHS